MPLDFSDPRYKGRPLLRFLDAYVLAVIGQLSRTDERLIADAVDRALGQSPDWKVTVRRAAGLPEDFDQRIRAAWDRQPDGVGTIAFVLAISNENVAPFIDPVMDDESSGEA